LEGGVIVLKKNMRNKDDAFIVGMDEDTDDVSVTRSVPGLRLRLETLQDDFPDEIYPGPMLALEVDPPK
jgi:hypothetical protein